MYERFEEYSETIERKHQNHRHEHEVQQKELSKLRIELTVVVSSVSECEKRLSERDRQIGDARREITEYKDNFKYLKEEHEETKKTLEETHLKLVASEEARRLTEEDTKTHHGELRRLRHQFVELQTSHSELTSKYESTYKEAVSLKQTNTALKKEKHEWAHEKGELEEDLKKCNHRNDEQKRKLKDISESYEKKVREVHELQESIAKIRFESEESHHKAKELQRQLEEEHCRWEDAEERCGKWKLKWEHSAQEIISIREEVQAIGSEQNELRETITRKTEELRRIAIEKEHIEEESHDACGKAEDSHRQVLVLQETLRRTETTLHEKTEMIHTINERIERIDCERDEARTKCSDLSAELSQLQSTVVSLKLEVETTTAERESISAKLRDCEARYEEIYESFTEYEEGNSGSEYEISSLRRMLREVWEEKEKSILMRRSADRERDEAVVRYEEKCREMERLEEKLSQCLHAQGRSGARILRRSFNRSVGAVNGDETETVTCDEIN